MAQTYLLYQLRVRSDFELSVPLADGLEPDAEFIRANVSDARPFPLTDSTYRPLQLASGATLHVSDGLICLQYPQLGDFYIECAERVACYIRPEASEAAVRTLLEGPMCAILLEMNGAICLHASAIQVDGRAVLFLGNSGSGKSSIAGYLHDQGYPLVSDDIVPIRFDEDECRAIPGPSRIKLADDMAAIFRRSGSFDPVAGKHIFPTLIEPSIDSFQRIPLSFCYVLQRDGKASTPAVVEELSAGERLVQLLKFSFCARVAGPLGLDNTRFQQLGRIANHMPVRRLRYRSGIEHLAAVRDAILADRASSHT